MGKVLFFDIDGTLVDFHSRMPESTSEALTQAKLNGHKLVICTGRPYTNIYPWLLNMDIFDAVIGSAGAYLYADKKELLCETFDVDKVKIMTDLLVKHNAFYLLQGRDGRFVNYEFKDRVESHFRKLGVDPEKVLNGITYLEDASQISDAECGMYFESDTGIEVMQRELSERTQDYFTLTAASYGPDRNYSGEMTRKGIDKATGMQKLLNYWGASAEETVAFGDGPNDFEMLAYAHTSVAMGNAIPELKTKADYVTSDIENDGISNALKRLHIIS